MGSRRLDVVILTAENCQFCEEAKALLERLAREYPLWVVMVDLATPQGQALARDTGVMFPPGIFIEGQPFSYGRPSERKLRRELAKLTES